MLRPRIRHLRVSTRDSPHANSCLGIEPDPNMYVQYFHNPAKKGGKDVSYTYTESRVVESTETKRFDYTNAFCFNAETGVEQSVQTAQWINSAIGKVEGKVVSRGGLASGEACLWFVQLIAVSPMLPSYLCSHMFVV
jgi:hypothetical protein